MIQRGVGSSVAMKGGFVEDFTLTSSRWISSSLGAEVCVVQSPLFLFFFFLSQHRYRYIHITMSLAVDIGVQV